MVGNYDLKLSVQEVKGEMGCESKHNGETMYKSLVKEEDSFVLWFHRQVELWTVVLGRHRRGVGIDVPASLRKQNNPGFESATLVPRTSVT